MSAPVDDLLAGSQAALQAGDATTARGLLEPLLEGSPGANVLELMARADYIDLDYQAAIARLERAYAAFRAERDPVGAVRVARTLSYLYMSFVGDFAVGNGWLARAQTLLGAAGETSERGWVALNRGLFEGDRAIKDDHFRTALAVARDHDDAELEVTALAYLGASLVHSDCTAEGMSLLDEALAAVAGREVDDFCVLEEVFCQLFSACERAGDVARADQWIRIGEAIAARRKLPTLLAFCRTHYGGVLTAAGRWAEADETLTAAVRLWGLGRRSGLRLGAFARLADLRVRQGRFEEAEQLLADLDPTAHDAAPAIIAVHLARGETLLARDVAEQALARLDPHSSEAAPLLALLVDVHLATGAVDEAGATAEHLAACARQHGSSHLVAAAALARGRVCAATGTGDPQACFREALAGFRHAQMPMELAQTRLELAAALAGDRPDVARVEARAALDTFEQLHAGRYADAAVALLRSLGVRSSTARQTAGVLTKREVEVLDLVGHGLSNPEIAQRLYISRKTVEHHVGNVLAKLGLRNRAEAVAYVVRAAPAGAEPDRD